MNSLWNFLSPAEHGTGFCGTLLSFAGSNARACYLSSTKQTLERIEQCLLSGVKRTLVRHLSSSLSSPAIISAGSIPHVIGSSR
jgi:hypothetical protein